MNADKAELILEKWIEQDEQYPWQFGWFGVLKETAPQDVKKLFRVYCLYMRRNMFKAGLSHDEEGNILGIGEPKTDWQEKQAKAAMKLIDQGWLPRKVEDLTESQIEEIRKTFFDE